MIPTTQNNLPIDERQRRRGRVQMILLALLFATPVLLGTWMYYFAPPTGRTNYGDLITPQVSLPVAQMPGLNAGQAVTYPWQGKWTMLSFARGACDEACAKQMYLMRQLRLVQGKDADNIERMLVLLDNTQLDQRVLAAYDGTVYLRDLKGELSKQFSDVKLPNSSSVDITQHIYLVDPLGNLMMRFPSNPDPSQMKKDLSKLLRLSAGWVRSSKAKDKP